MSFNGDVELGGLVEKFLEVVIVELRTQEGIAVHYCRYKPHGQERRGKTRRTSGGQWLEIGEILLSERLGCFFIS